MRNQAYSQWQLIDSSADRREEAWNLDRQAGLRSWILGGLVLVVLSVIVFRLYDLKKNRQAAFLANAHPITEIVEPIPAMDGRIYSSDGQLLAYDHQKFAVAVHYRWLEDPPHPTWWKQQARSRLSRNQYSNSAAMEAAKQAVLAQRADLWKRLSRLTQQPLTDIEQRRQRIQERVERIANSVRRRQNEREQAEFRDDDAGKKLLQEGWTWQGWWELVKSELTQPPRRESRDPIIIREELDYHELISDLTTRMVAEIESHPADYPGVQIITTTQRVYPAHRFASHILGNRTPLRADQIRERQKRYPEGDPLSYQIGDRQGQFGVERTYEVTLRGLPGSRRLEKDRRGEIIKSETVRQSRTGHHLMLSLNSSLQKTAEEILDELIPLEPSLVPPLPAGSEPAPNPVPSAGCLLVMNVHSGELVAAATAPRPDLTLMTAGDPDYWKQLTTDERSPLLSRLTQVTLAPGSIFKPVTAIAQCETEGIPTEPIFCRGYLDKPESHRCAIFQSAGVGHNEIGLEAALAESCNVYFFAAARRMGPHPLKRWCDELGFGKVTGVDLPFERSGHVPSPADNAPTSHYHWYPGDTLGVSIGQSYLNVTPLQMAVMTAAIANGGELITPRVARQVLPGDENSALQTESSLELPETPSRPLPVREATWKIIRAGMEQTVSHPRGTGYKTVRLPQVTIAGKTGTAQTGLTRPSHAWFVGYVPADRPQYAFVVVLEHGGAGGEEAGPPARKIVQRMLELDLISPQQSLSQK